MPVQRLSVHNTLMLLNSRGVHAEGERAPTSLLGIALAGERADLLGDCAVEIKAVATPALLTSSRQTKRCNVAF